MLLFFKLIFILNFRIMLIIESRVSELLPLLIMIRKRFTSAIVDIGCVESYFVIDASYIPCSFEMYLVCSKAKFCYETIGLQQK